MKPDRDAYGQEIWNCYKGKTTYEIVERDDGLIDLGSAQLYFMEYAHWSDHEREAIQFATGSVLDIGCGAGRVALHLQEKGLNVTAIDNSPLAVKVAKLRGVKDARLLSIRDINKLSGPFDTIVLYGNNFGLLGGRNEAPRLLKIMRRITSDGASIIASTVNPYNTKDPIHLAYLQRNRERGRMSGQIRLRIRYKEYCSGWFDYLLASPLEVREIATPAGWRVNKMIKSRGPGYAVVLTKI